MEGCEVSVRRDLISAAVSSCRDAVMPCGRCCHRSRSPGRRGRRRCAAWLGRRGPGRRGWGTTTPAAASAGANRAAGDLLFTADGSLATEERVSWQQPGGRSAGKELAASRSPRMMVSRNSLVAQMTMRNAKSSSPSASSSATISKAVRAVTQSDADLQFTSAVWRTPRKAPAIDVQVRPAVGPCPWWRRGLAATASQEVASTDEATSTTRVEMTAAGRAVGVRNLGPRCVARPLELRCPL